MWKHFYTYKLKIGLMTKNIGLIIIALLVFFSFLTFATKPMEISQHCYPVVEQEYYKTKVYNSEIFKLFKEWKLQNTDVPCQFYKEDARVFTRFVLPENYSSLKLKYEISIEWNFKNGELINTEQLMAVLDDYKKYVAEFETNKKVKLFLNITGIKSVQNHLAYPNIFLLRTLDGRNSLDYNFVTNSVDSFTFVNPQLLANLEIFLPQITQVPQIQEFKKIKSINFASFGNQGIQIAQDAQCPTCNNYLTYDLNEKIKINAISTYALDTSFAPLLIPDLLNVYELIRQKLLVGEFSNCVISVGDKHAYTIGTRGMITVAINCNAGTIWKDAFIRQNFDGTYSVLGVDIFSIKQKTSKNTKSIIIVSIIVILIILIAIILIKRYIKNR